MQRRGIYLKIFPLDRALNLPGFTLLNIYFLHPAVRKDILGGVADVLRHGIAQKFAAYLIYGTQL
jgi:hypothetical protein